MLGLGGGNQLSLRSKVNRVNCYPLSDANQIKQLLYNMGSNDVLNGFSALLSRKEGSYVSSYLMAIFILEPLSLKFPGKLGFCLLLSSVKKSWRL